MRGGHLKKYTKIRCGRIEMPGDFSITVDITLGNNVRKETRRCRYEKLDSFSS